MNTTTIAQAVSYVTDCEHHEIDGRHVASAPAFVLSATNREWGSLTYTEQAAIVALLWRAIGELADECEELGQTYNAVGVTTDYHVTCDCCLGMCGDAGQQQTIDDAMVRLGNVGWQWVTTARGAECWCPSCLAKHSTSDAANDQEAA